MNTRKELHYHKHVMDMYESGCAPFGPTSETTTLNHTGRLSVWS